MVRYIGIMERKFKLLDLGFRGEQDFGVTLLSGVLLGRYLVYLLAAQTGCYTFMVLML